MSAPLIEFAPFANPHEWWLRRGPPPWIEYSRGWVRAVRVTFVVGTLCAISALLPMVLNELLDAVTGHTNSWFVWTVLFKVQDYLCWPPVGPGIWFGVVVLLPLSRWLGRGWIMSLLAIPVAMYAGDVSQLVLAYFVPTMGHYYGHPFLPETTGWSPSRTVYRVGHTIFYPDGVETDEAKYRFWQTGPLKDDVADVLFDSGLAGAGFFAGFAAAALIGLWMGNPFRPSARWAGYSASLLAGLGCGLFFYLEPKWNRFFISNYLWHGIHSDHFRCYVFPYLKWIENLDSETVLFGLLYATFQILVGVSLGTRLWRSETSHAQ